MTDLAWAAEQQGASDSNETPHHVDVYLGTYWDQRGTLANYAGATFALFGNLDSSGFRLGLSGATGDYQYNLSLNKGTTDNLVVINKGYFAVADFLAGYEVVRDEFRTILLFGANYQDQRVNIPDPDNPAVGKRVGLKVEWNFSTNPTKQTELNFESSYSTAFRTYRVKTNWGYDISNGKEMFFGPEWTVIGNEGYDQMRVGVQLSSIKIGRLDFGVEGGYFFDLRATGTDNGPNGPTRGAYAGAVVSSEF